MLTTMKRQAFDILDPEALGWTCIEPVIREIQGHDLAIKSHVYSELTPGQRALLMFWVMHGHARQGLEQFFAETAYLLDEPDFWPALKAGARHFEDPEWLKVVGEIERVYGAKTKMQENNQEWLAAVKRLEAEYREYVPAYIRRIAEYIRQHPEEFVRLEE